MKPCTPIRIQKQGAEAAATAADGAPAGETAAACVPTGTSQAELLEVSPGVYDIVFHCTCGKRSVIRCESFEPGKKE